jgi:tetratricopeptide (TPR) repeat protein
MSLRLALIIGSSVYTDSALARLLTPDADVGAFADLLMDAEVGKFDDVKVLVNMSYSTVRRSISDFFSNKSREDLLLLYFSGHGVLDELGRLYLAVKNTECKLLRATAIPARFITDEMDNSRSKRQLLILDCCHSGAFARGTKGVVGERVGTSVAFEGTGFGRVVLTATDATQYAFEGEQVIGEAENSVFTYYLIRGLKTGEADISRDGKITVDELYDYVHARVVEKTPKQTPGKWSYKEQGEIIIANNPHLTKSMPEIMDIYEHENLDNRLEYIYAQGLGAFWVEEWGDAIKCFQAIVDLDSDYQDSLDKLKVAERQLKHQNLYDKALAAMEIEDWGSSISALEVLLCESPDYKDADRILEKAKKQKNLADLYAEAETLHQIEQWQAVVNIFSKISAIEPDFSDPQGLLSHAILQLNVLEQQEELEDLYNKALRMMVARRWPESHRFLSRITKIDPNYRDTKQLVERILSEMSVSETTAWSAKSLSRAPRWVWGLGGIIIIGIIVLILFSDRIPSLIVTAAETSNVSTPSLQALIPTQEATWTMGVTRSPTITKSKTTPTLTMTSDKSTITSTALPTIIAEVLQNLFLREGPGEFYPALKPYPQGTEMVVIGKDLTGDWMCVEGPDSRLGWMRISFLNLSSDLAGIPIISEISITPDVTNTKRPTSQPNEEQDDEVPTLEPPVVITEPPVVITEPPVVITESPVVITEPPVVRTEPPVVITEPPPETTEPPPETTEPPPETTEPPPDEQPVPTDQEEEATEEPPPEIVP